MFKSIVLGEVPSLYKKLEELRLLEEVDSDSLQYSLVTLPESKINMIPYISGSITVSAGAYFKYKWPGLVLSIGIISSTASLYGFVCYFVRREFEKFGDICSTVHRSCKTLFSFLKQRDVVSFGLGVTSPSQVKYRLKVFQTIRKVAILFSDTSNILVEEYNLYEEKEHLFSYFFADDMRELLTKNVDESSRHIADRGLGAVVDVIVLLRSELCRLVVLVLLKLENSKTAWNLFSLLRTIRFNLICIEEECKKLQVSFSEINRLERVGQPTELTHDSPLVKVAGALELVAQGIYEGKSDAESVQRALQRVLTMNAFISSKTSAQILPQVLHTPESDITTSHIIISSENVHKPIVDQVFETVVQHDEYPNKETTAIDEFAYPSAPDSSLMGELRNALGERSKEYEVRERKALAAFYGVSEEEILRREEEDREKTALEEDAKKQKEIELILEAVGENPDDDSFNRKPERPCIPLPSDLKNALASRFLANETTFGDDEEDEE